MSGKASVLILCTGNSCRSQMAEGFLREYQGDRFLVHSAGTSPSGAVHPLAIRVMQEIGINIASQKPKSIDDYLGKQRVAHVIIVCDHANGTCPRIWPGAFSRGYLPFRDPAHFQGSDDETLAFFRTVRDEISEAMKTWKPSATSVTQ